MMRLTNSQERKRRELQKLLMNTNMKVDVYVDSKRMYETRATNDCVFVGTYVGRASPAWPKFDPLEFDEDIKIALDEVRS